MSKTILGIITFGLVVALVVIFVNGSKKGDGTMENSVIKDGIQYITINAKGGYYPLRSIAKAGIPTKLVMKTNGSFDCSSSLLIRSLNYQKILPQRGEEIIDIGIPKAGEPFTGMCSMGMYNFSIEFI